MSDLEDTLEPLIAERVAARTRRLIVPGDEQYEWETAPRWLPLSRAAEILGLDYAPLIRLAEDWAALQWKGARPAVRVALMSRDGRNLMARWTDAHRRVEECDIKFPWFFDEQDLWDYWEGEEYGAPDHPMHARLAAYYADPIRSLADPRVSRDALPDEDWTSSEDDPDMRWNGARREEGASEGQSEGAEQDASEGRPWRYTAGGTRQTHVTAHERRPLGPLFLDYWDRGKRRRVSVAAYTGATRPVFDRDAAVRVANALSRELERREGRRGREIAGRLRRREQ
jgi:hypothetical protein